MSFIHTKNRVLIQVQTNAQQSEHNRIMTRRRDLRGSFEPYSNIISNTSILNIPREIHEIDQ